MKIVLIGAGSFVFGPTVLRDLIERHRAAGAALALVDVSAAAAGTMADLGRRMASDVGVELTITAHTDRREALPGADWVILSASPEGHKRWHMDYAILAEANLADQARECGALGGLSNSLRSISLTLAVCRDMERLCPHAPLLDVTNPMPRVVTAACRFTSIEAYGFCNAALGGPEGYDNVGGLLGRPAAELNVVTAGLNHFAFLVSVRDARSGEDLTGAAEQAVRNGRGGDLLARWLNEYGAVAVSGADHVAEYLPPDPAIRRRPAAPYHGSGEQRRRRWQQLADAARGARDWRQELGGGSWEHPVDVAVEVERRAALRLPMINLPNQGFLTDLPDGRIVEVPAVVEDARLRGVRIDRLPGRAGQLCRTVSDVHELVAEGAAAHCRAKLVEAVERDIAIPDKQRAVAALDEMLRAHEDLIGAFS